MRSSRRFESRGTGRRGAVPAVLACVLAALTASGCVSTVNEASTPAPNDPEFRALLDGVGRTYETRDVEKILDLYVSDTYSLSFDQTIKFDSGAADHKWTVRKLLEGVTDLKVAWAPDFSADRTSEKTWTTRHFVATATLATGEVREVSGWHSAIWSQRDGKWLIEYEHFRADSKMIAAAPLPPPPPPPPGPTPEEQEVAARESIRDVFFDYDKWDIRPSEVATLEIVLGYLQKYPGTEVTIEGHCDERGSTRYNINLGQKRADETKAWLVARGIAPERLRTISFGKSRPFESGRSEDAWQSNRRSHFVVTKGPQRP